ncbi:nucleotidyltransferase domain-containing protein [Ancylobacter sp. Lp-2]|uniref:nucleotidyltransferase domain-containing protein n=1 Tax=Ancylobacter sp. Lp-2 TaxID=2881339 RepID=UPI001E2B0DA6|nr:nucleotidyltransferase domain-containing protein [Ancylobacter sp. Lp-2]MCB4768614.1 nucleotidyltransferase domain-containing protein [Ancylobacter sp. Lp-2]
MRFCILVLLDLVDRGGGSDHISNLIDVIPKRPNSGHVEYSVVVFLKLMLKGNVTFLEWPQSPINYAGSALRPAAGSR